MSTVLLEVVTPDQLVLRTEVNMVSLRTGGGEVGILPRHMALAATVVPGLVKVQLPDGPDYLAVTEGFLHVKPDHVTILVNTAEIGWSIDVNRAMRAKERAERYLADRQGNVDAMRADAALHRALHRLQAVEHSEKSGEWLRHVMDKHH